MNVYGAAQITCLSVNTVVGKESVIILNSNIQKMRCIGKLSVCLQTLLQMNLSSHFLSNKPARHKLLETGNYIAPRTASLESTCILSRILG